MKKYWILVLCMLFSGMVFSQSRFSINLNGGLDYNSNKYYSPNGYSKFEDGKTDFNAGMDVGYRFSKLVRFRLEFKYVELH